MTQMQNSTAGHRGRVGVPAELYQTQQQHPAHWGNSDHHHEGDDDHDDSGDDNDDDTQLYQTQQQHPARWGNSDRHNEGDDDHEGDDDNVGMMIMIRMVMMIIIMWG